jgi:hypothetical protein
VDAPSADFDETVQGINGSFDGCTYSTTVPAKVSPSNPLWQFDVRSNIAFTCNKTGIYSIVHFLQIWNSRFNAWDNFNFWSSLPPPEFRPDPGQTIRRHNKDMWEPFCYRATMSLVKTRSDGTTVWTSPTIRTGSVSLGKACP